jgi:hypothetical protein
MAPRRLFVVVWTSVGYAPLNGSEQVMTVWMLLVATNTMMLSSAATGPVVGIVAAAERAHRAEVLHERDGSGGGGGKHLGGQGGKRRRQRHPPEEAASGVRTQTFYHVLTSSSPWPRPSTGSARQDRLTFKISALTIVD